MRFPFNRESRKVFWRRTKDFWVDFRRNRIGLVGLAVMTAFVVIAVFEPWLKTYSPIEATFLSDKLAKPTWVTFLPQYRDLPPTINLLINWHPGQGYDPSIVDVNSSQELVVTYHGGEAQDVYLTVNFSYPYAPNDNFKGEFRWGTSELVKDVGYSLELFLVRWGQGGQNYSLWDSYYCRPGWIGEKKTPEIPLKYENWTDPILRYVMINSKDVYLYHYRLGVDNDVNFAELAFSQKGEYGLLMHIRFSPSSQNATCQIFLKDEQFIILGEVHGLLGTDGSGRDIFSQWVSGVPIALAVGLSTALLTTAVGIFLGIVAGYVGGVVDEFLMRLVDVLLCLPIFPLIMVLVGAFGRLSLLHLVIIMAAFGWTGLARIARAQVLSLREMSFVESAKAVGSSRLHIILTHILPNVLPLAFAFLVLMVPAAILAEAGLSYIGFGDPKIMTWGRMLYEANRGGAFENLAWWWLLPPGLSITAISLAFMFIGHAVDEIVNPRLRRRR